MIDCQVDLLQDRTLAGERFMTMLLAGIALLALTLAAMGVYGVLADDVARRRKELGIRVALRHTERGDADGARPNDRAGDERRCHRD